MRYSNYVAPTPPAGADTTGFHALITDGDTKGWYEYGDGSATYMTDDGSVISSWIDLSGNSNHLVNASGTDLPTKDGTNSEIDFDGTDDYLADATFSYSCPTTVYLIARVNTWVSSENLFTLSFMKLNLSPTSATALAAAAGGESFQTGDSFYSVGNYYIIRSVFNNTEINGSKIQLNENSAYAGTLGTASYTYLRFPNESGVSAISVKALIVRPVLDSDAEQTIILNYLNNKYSIY
jgi:hypothetical protein